MLSIIIPARNEKYLEKTIRSILDNAKGEIEVLVGLDGWLPDPQIHTNDPRVVFYHEQNPIGQRQTINKLAKMAKGEFLMKLDAHCAVGDGFDIIITKDIEYDWTVIPRMYNLDINTWEPKLNKRTDYMLMTMEKGFLRAQYYPNLKLRQPKNNKMIDDTMSCMGPCFVMHTKRFWELGGCDENHGSWGAQSIEVSCKAWLSGGSLKVNKNTWFAHWFRGDEGFPYPLSGGDVDKARAYSTDLWLNDKWSQATRKFQWLLDKFNPPGWEEKVKPISEDNVKFYRHIHLQKHHPKWRGITILKMPSDLQTYHEVVWENKPDTIIEIGTKFGGTSLFLQDTLDMIGNGGKVITIDILNQVEKYDSRITYLLGDSKSEEIRRRVRELAKGQIMVILDGNHSRNQVKWECHYYAPMVGVGQYLVLEDCYSRDGFLYGPGQARDWFLSRNRRFINTNLERNFLVGFNYGGWLRRIR